MVSGSQIYLTFKIWLHEVHYAYISNVLFFLIGAISRVYMGKVSHIQRLQVAMLQYARSIHKGCQNVLK